MNQNNNENHANQCNPNNDSYWQSRGEDFRPQEWEEQLDDMDDDQSSMFNQNNHSNQMNPNHPEYKK